MLFYQGSIGCTLAQKRSEPAPPPLPLPRAKANFPTLTLTLIHILCSFTNPDIFIFVDSFLCFSATTYSK